MSYDLLAWPVDRAMSADEARVEIQARSNRWPMGLGREPRIDAFARAMQLRYPGLGSLASTIPMEFDVHRSWVFMALPWSYVAGLIAEIAPLAFETGLALYDPQRDLVALPAPFGEAPLGTEGVFEHERLAEQAFDLIREGAAVGRNGDVLAGTDGLLRDAGFKLMSPLGFEITPDVEQEVAENPLRVPTRLQTAARKAELLDQLGSEVSGRQQAALTMLGGWDQDAEVRAALRRCLEGDDVYVVSLAATGLAHQGSPADLDALLVAVFRMSPSDGASLDSMLGPLMAALELAELAGPDAVADVRSKAREWRHPASGVPRPRGALDDELDRLLGD